MQSSGQENEIEPEGLFESGYWREDSQYSKFADYRDGFDRTKRWYAGFVRMIGGELPPHGRHLDAGCGHGAIVELMRERGLDSYGVDASNWMIDQAKRAGMGDRLQVGDLESDVPFDGSFDVITCLEVLEHLEHPDRALGVLASRLAPGGRLIATTPNLRPGIPWNDPVAADPTHVNVHQPDWWADCVERAGLAPRGVSTFIAVPFLWRLSTRLSLWFRMGPQAGPAILVVAERPAA
jgi:SAM-dependent methyltransferase